MLYIYFHDSLILAIVRIAPPLFQPRTPQPQHTIENHHLPKHSIQLLEKWVGTHTLPKNTDSKLTSSPGRFEITHSGPIPAGVNKEKAVAVLHDHDGYFRAAEHYKEHKQLPSDSGKDHKVPSEIQARAAASAADVKVYTVRNDVPNPVFDSKVNTEYEVVDLVDGIWYRASSAMGVVNEGLWTVEEGSGGLELRVSIQVECNAMLKGLVKGQVQSGAEQIHKNLIAVMEQ